MDNSKPIIAVIGPTASGKSKLAVAIASRIGGEVISADSRQVYRGMDIGTNKITPEEMRGVPHHLLDVANPEKQFTVADYNRLAREALMYIRSRGKIPVVCGGTGFYIDALLCDTTIPSVPPRPELRAELEKESAEALYEKLERLDPRRAATIEAKNKRRLIRALEIIRITGSPVPPLSRQSSSEGGLHYNTLFIAPYRTREELKERIAARADTHLDAVIEETKKLHDGNGLLWERLDSFGLEYRYAARYLQGKLTKTEMRDRLVAATWRYAKRQLAWCAKHPVHWVTDIDKTVKEEYKG